MFYIINLKKYYKIFITIFVAILFFVSFRMFTYIFPLKYLDTIKVYAKEYQVNESLICAIINVESRFKNNAVSVKGASGLMQIMSSTANWVVEKERIKDFNFDEDIFDVKTNIKIGVYYLKYLLNKYDNDEILALASYNAGLGNISKWLKDPNYSRDSKTLDHIPFKETEEYVKKVMFNKKVYKIMIGIVNFINKKI